MNPASHDYRALEVSERIELVGDIWDSIAEDTNAVPALSPEDARELRRRLDAHLADPSSSIPWPAVRASLLGGAP